MLRRRRWSCSRAPATGGSRRPAFEDTELFARGVGEGTDIVNKEMFTFTDQGGRALTLRPEGTAAVCRAYVEHGMHKLPQPVKLWYWGPFFRHERPQAGRFREFNQIGAEAIGTDSPLADAEIDHAARRPAARARRPRLRLRLSSLGTPASRAAYREELREYLREHEGELSRRGPRADRREPAARLRRQGRRTRSAVMAEAPRMLDRLDDADAEHFAEVRRLLDQCRGRLRARRHPGPRPRLLHADRVRVRVRAPRRPGGGLGGGGRYDGLVEALGGPPTAGVGWAAGIERILMALDEPEPEPAADVFVVAPDGSASARFALVRELRGAGLRAELDLAGRSIKGQMKQADRIGARRAVILDEDGGAEVRDMATGEQGPLDLERAVEELSR